MSRRAIRLLLASIVVLLTENENDVYLVNVTLLQVIQCHTQEHMHDNTEVIVRAYMAHSVFLLLSVPTSPPRSFTVLALGNSTLQLQWLSPLETDLNGDVCKYPVVYYRLGDVNFKFNNEFGARYRSGVLEHLDAWTTYNVSLAAETCGGEGGIGPYASVVQTTEEGGKKHAGIEAKLTDI